MTDNVIEFPSHRGAREEAERRERERSQQDRLRLAEIEATTKGKGPAFGESDSIIAARALHALVREAKQAGVTAEKIKGEIEQNLVARGKTGKKPGTDRLERYVAGENAQKRKLPQRVFGYLEFAATIAKLTKRDPGECKLKILKETQLWSHWPDEDDDIEDPRAANLALLLRAMSDRAIRTAKLPKLFSRARQIPGVWDVDLECFRPSEMACLFQRSYLDWFEHWTEAPPLPSVPLVRHAHAEFITEVRIERDAVSSPHDPASVQPEFDGDIAVASFALQREIRLALGPTTSASCLGPMLETRAHVSLRLFRKDAPVEQRRLLPSATLKPIDDSFHGVPASVFQVQFEDGWHRVVPLQRLDEVGAISGRGTDPFMWATNPFDPKSSVEHWYFSWIPVNEQTVRHCLDRLCGKSTEVCIPQSATGKEDLGAVWYSRPSAASHVEEALANGTLERALTNSIEKISAALGQREAEWKEKARVQTANLLSRFRGESTE